MFFPKYISGCVFLLGECITTGRKADGRMRHLDQHNSGEETNYWCQNQRGEGKLISKLTS